jgi:hypothetical protein
VVWLFVWVYLVFLSLFGQNKLDVSPCGWMLQKASFVDGPHDRVSLFLFYTLIVEC